MLVRAYLGTGDYLKLNKRDCDICFRLIPFDVAVLCVDWQIGGHSHHFVLNGDYGCQFSSFLTAVYCLYTERDDNHMWIKRWNNNFEHTYPYYIDNPTHTLKTFVEWDSEQFGWNNIQFTRHTKNTGPARNGQPDPVDIEVNNGFAIHQYTVDGRDLCYAIAKGCTEVIKKYGLRGYLQFAGEYYNRDSFNFDELLFVKAYALGCINTGYTKELWEVPGGWIHAQHSAFEKEIELLAFDM